MAATPVETIRQRLAALSGQEPDDVFLFPSGMAANYAVHRMLTHLLPARKTVQLDFPYVDVLEAPAGLWQRRSLPADAG
jgi:cystathionine gamma-synthase